MDDTAVPRVGDVRAALLALAVIACLFAETAAAQSLTPTGQLRVAFLSTNPVHARIDPATGAITGPVPDLVQEIARRLGVPFQLAQGPDAAGVIAKVQGGTVDLGVLAYEEARAREVDFAGPFAVMLSSYLVRGDSPIRTLADADHDGYQIGAARGVTQQLYLSAHLARARVRVFDAMPASAEVQRLLATDTLQAFGLNQQRGEDAVAASGGALRLVPGSFVDVEQSFVVKKGDRAAAAQIERIVGELRASGFVKTSLERAKLAGVIVAPDRR